MDSSDMGKKRWAGSTADERKLAMQLVRAHISVTKKHRTEIARLAAAARWRRAKPGST